MYRCELKVTPAITEAIIVSFCLPTPSMQKELRRKSQTVPNAAPQREAHVGPNRSRSADLNPRTPRPTGRHGRPPRPNAIILGSPDIKMSRSHRSTCSIFETLRLLKIARAPGVCCSEEASDMSARIRRKRLGLSGVGAPPEPKLMRIF